MRTVLPPPHILRKSNSTLTSGEAVPVRGSERRGRKEKRGREKMGGRRKKGKGGGNTIEVFVASECVRLPLCHIVDKSSTFGIFVWITNHPFLESDPTW